MPIDRTRFPCWTCTQPAASEARHWLANCDDSDLELRLSPWGSPLMCCRIRLVGVVPKDQSRVETF
jgi:hypothetical protein